MRIFSTILWGLVCLSAIAAGGYLASELAGERSESWSAAGAATAGGQAIAKPRTQFFATGDTRLARGLASSQDSGLAPVQTEPPTLRLVQPTAGKTQAEPRAAAELTMANFNEDDRLGQVASQAIPQIQSPPSLASGAANRATEGLNTRAPVLSLPSFENHPATNAANKLANQADAAGQKPFLALASPDGLSAIPEGIGLAALSTDGAALRGLEAQGKSVSLSLFGYGQDQANANSTIGDADAAAQISGQNSGQNPASKAKAVETKMPAEETPIPSWAEIDPNLQVASLSESPELTPGYKPSTPKASRNSFPRLDISVALYGMHEDLPASQKADRILVEKGARLLHLIDGDQLVKSYRIDLGFSPVGHKLAEGDGKTPEGDYRIDWRKRDSEFYRALHISYPSEQDASIAKFSGRDPGGAIMIHGRPNGFSDDDPLAPDWTAGCIAVKNAHIEEIWAAIDDGAAIRIRP